MSSRHVRALQSEIAALGSRIGAARTAGDELLAARLVRDRRRVRAELDELRDAEAEARRRENQIPPTWLGVALEGR